jgi:hypothetical protein
MKILFKLRRPLTVPAQKPAIAGLCLQRWGEIVLRDGARSGR